MAAAGSVVAAALLWSSSYAVTKKVLAEVGPLTIGAIRFTLAAGILFVVVRLRRGAPARPDLKQRRAMYGTGLLGITVYFVLENIGVQLSAASDASLIVATYPLMTMVLERVVLRTPVPLHRIGGVLLAGAGAALVVRSGSKAGGSARWAGDLLLLGYLAAACSVGGFLFYNYGLRRMTSSAAVNILNLVPVCGVISAVLIDGETVRPIQLIGGAVIIAGVSIGVIDRTPAPVTPARLL